MQAGKNNNQTLGVSKAYAPSVSIRPQRGATSETKVDQSIKETTNNELPPLVWIIGLVLFIVGWVTDTPMTYLKNFRKKK